jgi:ferredoxin
MAKIIFQPSGTEIEAAEGTKVLQNAIKNKVEITYGCASCRCGTCGVEVLAGELSAMAENERTLLENMRLPTDGRYRLSCQARMMDTDVSVDLGFQIRYSPERGIIE